MKWTASTLFRMIKDVCMLELPCREIHRDVSARLCFQLNLETCTKLQGDETSPWESRGRLPTRYRHWRPPTNHTWWWKPAKVVGLPENPVGWPVSSPGFCIFCNKGKRETRQSIFNICVPNHSPRHYISIRECSPWSSCHQSRIPMHDGRGVELHDSIWNECICKHLKPTTLSWIVKSVGDQESRHVLSLCLRNVPRFPCLD